MLLGYIRVSCDKQATALQEDAMQLQNRSMPFNQRLYGTNDAGVSVFSGMLTLDEKTQACIFCTRTPGEMR